jgi:hypothetical protein
MDGGDAGQVAGFPTPPPAGDALQPPWTTAMTRRKPPQVRAGGSRLIESLFDG